MRSGGAAWRGGMSGPRRKKAPKGFKSQKKPDVIDQDEAWLQQQMQEQQGASIYNINT